MKQKNRAGGESRSGLNGGSRIINIRYSIGAKLITIISIIVLLSLGSITVLVSWLFREDLRIAAEDNNFEVNRRSAMETENTLVSTRSNSMLFMQAVYALKAGDISIGETVDFFFEQNSQVALILFARAGKAEDFLINKQFFLSRGVDSAPADSLIEDQKTELIRAAMGETVIKNMAPWYKTTLLALFLPWHDGALAVLFSPANLNDSYGFGTNQSCLINDSGDIIIHPDFELLRTAANISGDSFTKSIWESPQKNAQVLYTDEGGMRLFGAFTKLNIGGVVVITNIEYDKVFEGIAATTRRNIFLTAAVLSISVLFIWFFSKSISIPIRALAVAARTIENGSFDIKLKPSGNDEVGFLTTSFLQMSSALAIFGKFTNREIALRAMRGEIKPGGQPKLATIFFSDIRGFSEKTAAFTREFGEEAPNRIVQWLNDYYTRMVECIEKTGGVVDKFDGDAIMAHWGTVYTSGSPQKDAYNSVYSALMMRKILYEMNKSRDPDDPGNPPIRIGVGINTGIVIAGQIGSESRMEYTVVGDPVNLAFRTEALNKSMATDILITKNTWDLVKDLFITEKMPLVMITGEEKPVQLFAVINFAGINKGPRNLASVRKLLGIKAIKFKRRMTDISLSAAERPAGNPGENDE